MIIPISSVQSTANNFSHFKFLPGTAPNHPNRLADSGKKRFWIVIYSTNWPPMQSSLGCRLVGDKLSACCDRATLWISAEGWDIIDDTGEQGWSIEFPLHSPWLSITCRNLAEAMHFISRPCQPIIWQIIYPIISWKCILDSQIIPVYAWNMYIKQWKYFNIFISDNHLCDI